jgi:hypothetical protein
MSAPILPFGRSADWSRRTFMVALAATVYGCASNQRRGDQPQQTDVPNPPSGPDITTPAETPARPLASNPQVSPSASRAIEYVLQQSSDHPKAAIVDFSAHSSIPRFHVVDRASGQVLESFRVAHGHGSEGKRNDGYAEVFSNEHGSNASSLGLYRTAETYRSDIYPGLSMRLDGLSPTNSNARARYVVIHEASYMEPKSWKGKKKGHPGCSDGCFAFCKADRDAVIAHLEGGALIYASYEKRR